MFREIGRLLQTAVNLAQESLIFGVLALLCASAAIVHAQEGNIIGEKYCFAIHVSLNGKQLADPQTVKFKTDGTEIATVLKDGCFAIPPIVLNQSAVDVFFEVPGNKVYLSSIAPGFFVGPWDVELEDKRFGRDVVLPKHARAKETCVVTFHNGEPGTVRAQAPCRIRTR